MLSKAQAQALLEGLPQVSTKAKLNRPEVDQSEAAQSAAQGAAVERSTIQSEWHRQRLEAVKSHSAYKSQKRSDLRKLTPRQRLVCELRASGFSYPQISQATGYAPGYCSKITNDPLGQHYLKQIYAEKEPEFNYWREKGLAIVEEGMESHDQELRFEAAKVALRHVEQMERTKSLTQQSSEQTAEDVIAELKRRWENAQALRNSPEAREQTLQLIVDQRESDNQKLARGKAIVCAAHDDPPIEQ